MNSRRFRSCAAGLALVAAVATGTLAGAGTPAAAAAYPSNWSTLCTTIGGTSAPLVAGVNCRLVVHDGLTRRYLVYVPAAVAGSSASVPVVFMFHGSSGSGEQFLQISGWREVADREHLIAVFPTGRSYRMLDTGRLLTKWHDPSLSCDVAATRPTGWPASSPYPANDVGFTDAMLFDVAAHEQVDSHRFYASGFSNGSAFAQRLSLERSDVFAAVGSWAGQARECVRPTGEVVEPISVPEHAIPVALGLGNRDAHYVDAINTWLSQHGEPAITELPVTTAFLDSGFGTAILRNAVEHLGLQWQTGTPIGIDDWAGAAWWSTWPAPQYVTEQWTTPAVGRVDRASFTFMLLGGVTHRWPNATPGKPTLIKQSGSVHAATLFWNFFERNPR